MGELNRAEHTAQAPRSLLGFFQQLPQRLGGEEWTWHPLPPSRSTIVGGV